MALTVQEQFGAIDIYVFDQILRGNISPAMQVLDAGCGSGRNLVYLLRQGCPVYALDANPEAVEHVRQLAAECGNPFPEDRLAVGRIERMPFPDAVADVVLCNSVLHFADSDTHFNAMLAELWRVLKPGGLLFCRLGSQIGARYDRVDGNHFHLGEGTVWYLLDEEQLLAHTRRLRAQLVDPLKTTVVQDHRSMTTWVLRKAL